MTPAEALPGLYPDDFGLAVIALERHQRAKRDAEGPRATADDTALRGSWARDCARRIAFQVLDVPPDLDIDGATLTAFEVGRSFHESIQAALVAELGAECEVAVSYKDEGLDLSGHADGVYTHDGEKVLVEIKSVAAYGWNLAVSGNRYEGPGPKAEHLTQAGLYALAPQVQAHAVHMIYVNKDKGTVAEWVIGVDEPLPHLNGETVRWLAEDEKARMADILDALSIGAVPARDIPGFGVVDNPPPRGSKGQPWSCRYCGHQPTCAGLPTETFPVALLRREEVA